MQTANILTCVIEPKPKKKKPTKKNKTKNKKQFPPKQEKIGSN